MPEATTPTYARAAKRVEPVLIRGRARTAGRWAATQWPANGDHSLAPPSAIDERMRPAARWPGSIWRARPVVKALENLAPRPGAPDAGAMYQLELHQ